jgi:precorrin-3B methylase
MEDLIKLLRHTQTHDIVVLGCGDANVYGLHPSYLSLASASI